MRKKKLTGKLASAAKVVRKKPGRQIGGEASGQQEEERVPDPAKDAGYFDKEGVFQRAR